jgi:hypothetical protein
VSHPSTFTSAKLSIVVKPLTKFLNIFLSSFSIIEGWQIFVPEAEVLKTFLIIIGIPYRITGLIVRGCKTFAPKYDCKRCSLKVNLLNFKGTRSLYAFYFPVYNLPSPMPLDKTVSSKSQHH